MSSAVYSPLFLIPWSETAGDTLFVALKTPPSSTGTYSKRTPVRRSIAGTTRWAQIGVGGAEVEVELGGDGHGRSLARLGERRLEIWRAQPGEVCGQENLPPRVEELRRADAEAAVLDRGHELGGRERREVGVGLGARRRTRAGSRTRSRGA